MLCKDFRPEKVDLTIQQYYKMSVQAVYKIQFKHIIKYGGIGNPRHKEYLDR